MRISVFLWLGLGCLAALPVQAAVDEHLHEIETQLGEGQEKAQQLDAAAKAQAKSLEDLRGRLIGATGALQDTQENEESLEARRDELTHDIAVKSQNAAREKARLAQLLSSLVELAEQPPSSLFLQSGPTTDHIRRSILLRALLPQIRDQAERESRDLALLLDLQSKLGAQEKLVAATRTNLQRQRQELDQMIAARQGYLAQTEKEKADMAQRLAALSSEAKNLRELMSKLTPSKPLPALSRGSMALTWPVGGAVKHRFGERDADGVRSEGVTFFAASAAPVVAPRAGRVVFEGPFRGYGKIVILQHDGGFHSFMAGFGRIDAAMGQYLATGEPLGVMPVSPGSRPELYFEWRRGEEPVDPAAAMPKRN